MVSKADDQSSQTRTTTSSLSSTEKARLFWCYDLHGRLTELRCADH